MKTMEENEWNLNDEKTIYTNSFLDKRRYCLIQRLKLASGLTHDILGSSVMILAKIEATI